MAAILDRLIWYDHPRTGSSSVLAAILALGGSSTKRHEFVESDLPIKACTVRNPWDLMVSWWFVIRQRQRRWKTLEGFLRGYDNRDLTRNGTCFYFAQYCNRVLRFETLQQDFNSLLTELGRRPYQLSRKNPTASRQRDYHIYYNEITRQLVAERFAKEIAEFGYSYE